MIGIPVRLSHRSLHREGQKKFVKNFPQWGLKPGPPGPGLCSFLESIEHDFIKAIKIQAGN